MLLFTVLVTNTQLLVASVHDSFCLDLAKKGIDRLGLQTAYHAGIFASLAIDMDKGRKLVLHDFEGRQQARVAHSIHINEGSACNFECLSIQCQQVFFVFLPVLGLPIDEQEEATLLEAERLELGLAGDLLQKLGGRVDLQLIVL